MNIAKYVASIGFDVNTRDIQKVDRALGLVEKKLKDFKKRSMGAFSIELSNFVVNQQKLNRSLGDALDIASSKVTFEITRFAINDRNLQASLIRAGRRLGTNFVGPKSGSNKFQPLSAEEFDRRRGILADEATLRHQRKLELMQLRGLNSRTSGRGLGGIGLGLMGPIGYGALALAGGGYGLSALNQRNQEVVSAQLQTAAVAQQATGDSYTPQIGAQSFQWLRNQAQETGFNYLEAVPNYNKLVSGIVGAGGTLQQGQGIFKGFSELSRVYKLGQVQQNRLFKGLSDVAGKDQLMSEELNFRLAA